MKSFLPRKISTLFLVTGTLSCLVFFTIFKLASNQEKTVIYNKNSSSQNELLTHGEVLGASTSTVFEDDIPDLSGDIGGNQNLTVIQQGMSKEYVDAKINELQSLFAVNTPQTTTQVVSRAFLTQQTDSIVDSFGNSINNLRARIEAVENNTGSGEEGGGNNSSASTTLLGDFNTFTNTTVFTGNIGIGTSTVNGLLTLGFPNSALTSFAQGNLSIMDPNNGGYASVQIGGTYGANINLDKGINNRQGIDASNITGSVGMFANNTLKFYTNGNGNNLVAQFGTDTGAPNANTYFTGNMGIGTSTPYAKLSIDNTGNNGVTPDLRIANGTDYIDFSINNVDTALGSIIIKSSIGGGLFFGDTYQSYIASDNDYLTFTAGGAQRMHITGGGNVGIGTTTPSFILNPFSSTASQLALSAGAGLSQWAFRNAGGNLYLATTTVAGSATSSVAALTIDTNGKVIANCFSTDGNTCITAGGGGGSSFGKSWEINGAGRLAPTTTIDLFAPNNIIVDNNITITNGQLISGLATISSGNFGGSRISLDSSGVSIGTSVTKAGINFTSGASYDPIDTGFGRLSAGVVGLGNGNSGNTSGTLIIGRLGIATSSPWKSLSVAGGVALPALSNDSTGYYACVNTTTGELSTSTTACGASSIKFKENVQDLAYGLEEVLKLRPVSFDYKDEYIKNGRPQVGFIAEEVAPIIPEVVAYDDMGEIQGLDYPKFTSVLVKAVQELYAKVDQLANTVMVSLTAETIYTKTITIEKGIEIKDQVTSDLYCLTIESGTIVTKKGTCSNPSINTVILPEEPIVSSTTPETSSIATTTLLSTTTSALASSTESIVLPINPE